MKFILRQFILALTVFVGTTAYSQFTDIQQATTNSFYFVEVNEPAGVCLAGGIKFIKSTDEGITWAESSLGAFGLPATLFTYHAAEILDNNTYLLVGNDNTNKKSIVIRSANGGGSWQMVASSSNNSYQFARDVASNGSTVMVATKNGVWRSTDAGLNFSFVPVTTQLGQLNATTIEYFPSTGKWIWRYENNETFQSSNDGISWSPLGGVGAFELTNRINLSNTQGIWTNKSYPNGDTCAVYFIDGNGSIEQQLDFHAPVIQSGQLEEVFPISGTEYLAHDHGYFYLIDASDSTIEQFTHNLYSQYGGFPSEVSDADMGLTYGIAVGEQGAISRFDKLEPFETRVYADFEIPSQACPNEFLELFPMNPSVDSVEWWINNQLVSTQQNYSWNVPVSQSSIQVKLKIWRYGYVDSTQQNISIIQEQQPVQYNLTSGLTPCYGVTQLVYFQYASGYTYVPGSFTLLMYQGDTMAYHSPSHNYGMSFYTPPVYEDDTVFLYVSRPQTCGYSVVDTIEYIIQAGINMVEQFDFSTEDTLYCSPDNPAPVPYQINLELTNLTTGLTYQVTNNFGATLSSFVATTDSVMISQPSTVAYNYYTEPPYDAHYIAYYLKVTGPTGCTSGVMFLDSVQVIKPWANFSVEPQVYLLNDTVDIVNNHYAFYTDWSFSNPIASISNTNDTVPILTSALAAVGSLQLINNPIPGCSDTASRTIYFGETVPSLVNDVCFVKDAVLSNGIVDITTDNEGNTIEVCTKSQGTTSVSAGRSVFSIAKRDPNGNLLWIKSPATSSSYYNRCIIIDKIELDDDGNVYALIRWNWQNTVSYEMINYYNFDQRRKAMIMKLDAQTGNMLWYSGSNDYRRICW